MTYHAAQCVGSDPDEGSDPIEESARVVGLRLIEQHNNCGRSQAHPAAQNESLIEQRTNETCPDSPSSQPTRPAHFSWQLLHLVPDDLSQPALSPDGKGDTVLSAQLRPAGDVLNTPPGVHVARRPDRGQAHREAGVPRHSPLRTFRARGDFPCAGWPRGSGMPSATRGYPCGE